MNLLKTTLLFLVLSFNLFSQSSENQFLIKLAKNYKDFMFMNQPEKKLIQELKTQSPQVYKNSTEFIIQTITAKNKLATVDFLKRPSNEVLKEIYIVHEINLILRDENKIDLNVFIDSVNSSEIPVYQLIDNYYGMLFTGIGNKNKPFNYSKVNFELDLYGFKDETEKGIFVLRCMKDCNSEIWGYMNIANPPNTKKAYESIKKYPKFNGQPYYQYTDFYFSDFEMEIIDGKGLQSYKSYYLDKFFETLIFHLICLNDLAKPEEEVNKLLLGSILKEEKLYKYTKYQEMLKETFVESK